MSIAGGVAIRVGKHPAQPKESWKMYLKNRDEKTRKSASVPGKIPLQKLPHLKS
jgi:hypothetical protein